MSYPGSDGDHIRPIASGQELSLPEIWIRASIYTNTDNPNPVNIMFSGSLKILMIALVMTSVLLVPFAVGQSPDGPLPDAPQNLNASLMSESIHLSWSSPDYTGTSYIEGYIVYRGESSGSEGYFQETTSTDFEDPSIEWGRTYYYQISARNSAGEGMRSYEVSVYSNPRTWTVSGRCTEQGSISGIEGVRISFEEQISPNRSFETWTDSSGAYSVDLPESTYRVTMEADGYRSNEDYLTVEGPTGRYFTLEKEEGGEDGDEDKDGFNLTEILGIDKDEIRDFAMTAIIIVASFLLIIPISFLIILIFLLIIFIRLGKIRKELRAKNETEGLFISKRRQRKHERKIQAEKTSSGPDKEKTPSATKKEKTPGSSRKKGSPTVKEIPEEEED